MKENRNALGQPIGYFVPHWQPARLPGTEQLEGRYCLVERLSPERHGRQLFSANAHDAESRNWTYLAYGPFDDFAGYEAWLRTAAEGIDPLFYAVVDRASGEAVGVASYLRIAPKDGTIEVGHINFSPLLQRRTAASEAMFLMMEHAFALGYRRYEWKCDALNAPSRAAAERLGFTFEGVFRNATLYKGRNRDTAWYSITDYEWPRLEAAFRRWLDPGNFDAEGRQKVSLSALTRQVHGGQGSSL